MLRNREFLSEILIKALITAVVSITVYFVLSATASVFCLALGLCMILVSAVFSAVRYKRMSGLCNDIDRILHGEESISLCDYSEGELSILQSELKKLTVLIREQDDMLKKDKIRLCDLLADVSHQVRTPLTSMELIASFLGARDISDEDRLKYCAGLQTMLRKIDWLISALLKMSRIDAGAVEFKDECHPLEELVKKAYEPVSIPMDLKNQQLVVNVSGSFFGDIMWSAEAVGNIIKNCMEHMNDGGVLKIDGCENALYSELLIHDSGDGISDEDLPHLFDRFYKGNNSAEQSVGIGLALSRAIVAGQGGTLTAQNHREGGALFIVRFYKSVV